MDAGKTGEGRVRLFLRRAGRVCWWLYLGCLLSFLIFISVCGERHWLSAAALYAPFQLFLLPLAVLFPFAPRFKQRRWPWLIIPILAVCFCYMDFHWTFWQKRSSDGLVVITSNIGQRKTRTLWPFLEEEKPDVLVLQEAFNHNRTLSHENPDRYVASRGEFVVVSKFEIRNSGVVPGTFATSGPIAAWFELDYHGQSIVVYNVHLPTPRSDITTLTRGRGILHQSGREQFGAAMNQRLEMIKTLLAHFEREQRPFVVAGDFNMPSPGYAGDLVSDRLTDVFAMRGRGYGFTFPGTTRNPLTLFGPWLRIDYIFCSAHWKPTTCRVEPRQPAQHLAVMGQLELTTK
jgi:vancomycin resistance protein VanJ